MSRWNKSQKTGDRCILTRPLSYNRLQRKQLDKTFQMVNNIKNMVISWYDTQLHEMIRTRVWRENKQALRELYEAYTPDLEALKALLDEVKGGKKPSKTKQKKINHLQARAEEFQTRQHALVEVRNAIIKLQKYYIKRGWMEPPKEKAICTKTTPPKRNRKRTSAKKS